MEKKIFLAIVLTLSFCLSGFGQDARGIEIRDRDIEWADFTGEVDPASRFDAYTYWYTTYSYPAPERVGDAVRVNLTIRLFLRSDSWVRPNKKTDRLLNHEQGHYRIGRICANEIEATVNEMEFSRDNYRKEIDAVYWKVIKKYQAINKQYDADTNHYHNRQQQAVWDRKLEELLNGN
jgi:hypothetical protein